MDKQKSPTIDYFLNHLDLLHWRDYLQELFTIPDRQPAFGDKELQSYVVHMERAPYIGKLVEYEDALWSITSVEPGLHMEPGSYKVGLAPTGIIPIEDEPLLKPNDPVVLQPGVVANYPEGESLQTTVGRVLLNYLILAMPFGNIVPYINKLWKPGDLEKIVGDHVIRQEVTVEQVNTYIANIYFLGHAPELVVPNLSEKALTTDPRVAERKKELLEQHKEAIAAGDAVVMSQIEQELIDMDKAWLKGDSSMGYYISGKSFDIHRKKLLLTHGMVEAFGDTGNYDFVTNSLEEGWTADAFPKLANEIRAGSYARAKETAKGGEESKFLARVFQNSRIVMEDCGTKHTLDVVFRADNASDYVYRNHINVMDIETLTLDSAKTLIGKRVRLRSPLFCEAPGGYCFCCMGQMFKTLDQRVLATAATAIGAQMSISALKKMHGQSVSTVEVTSLNEFVV